MRHRYIKSPLVFSLFCIAVGILISNNCSRFRSLANNMPSQLGQQPSGQPTALNLYSAVGSYPINACSGPLTLALLNANGTSASSLQNLSVQMNVGESATASLYLDSSCTQNAAGSIQIPAGRVLPLV